MERLVHNLVQGSDAWHQFRLEHDGASEAAAALGLSKKVTRSELLRMKHTGIAREFSDWVQENVLDYGHEVEELARPIMAEILGVVFYPATYSYGRLSASCDGLTMDGDTAFEHKQWNAELAAAVARSELPDEHQPQCQQIMHVTGAERVIFTVSDGTRENLVWMEVLPDPSWVKRIDAGWVQFHKDLAEYQPVEIAERPKADVVVELPALFIHARGEITTSNMEEYGQALAKRLSDVRSIVLATDQDFSNAKEAAKLFREQREKLEIVKAAMLAQTTTIGEAARMIDAWREDLRLTALQMEKDVEREDLAKKSAMVSEAKTAYQDHINALYAETKPIELNVKWPDFSLAIKNKRSYTSMQDAVDTLLANAKIAADQIYKDVRTKLAWCKENAAGYHFLFNDLQQIVYKATDDFQLLVKSRIAEHKAEEERKLEAERARIRAEEEAKAAEKAKAAQEAEHAEFNRQQGLREAEAVRIALASEAEKNTSATACQKIGEEGTGETPALGQRETLSAAPVAVVQSIQPAATVDTGATIKLGEISERLGFTVTADFLALLGFQVVKIERAAKLYRACDFPAICAAIVRHVQMVANDSMRIAA